MFKWLSQNKLSIAGIITGAVAGYIYWKWIGCASGTCLITSKPLNSTLYGAFMGYLIMGLFKKDTPLPTKNL